MRISLAFDPSGNAVDRTAFARSAAATRRCASPPPQTLPDRGEDVGLEALGQVLAEPRGFPARVEAVGSDVPMHAMTAEGRPASHLGSSRFFVANRIQRAVLGGLDAAIVVILLVGSMAVTGHHLIGALDGLVGVHDTAAQATTASRAMIPHVAGRVTDPVTPSAPVPGQGS